MAGLGKYSMGRYGRGSIGFFLKLKMPFFCGQLGKGLKSFINTENKSIGYEL